MNAHSRRSFVKTGLAAGALTALGSIPTFGINGQGSNHPICIFSKHLQWLDFTEMARFVKELGFDGIDLTVRNKGHVPPEKVEKLLPVAIEKIKKEGVSVPMMATSINNPDDPLTEKVLKTAAEHGIRYYRMAYYRFKKGEDLRKQLDGFRAKVQRLAELNEKYKIFGAYQNHSGNYVGASIWDFWYVIKDMPSDWIGFQFDIRHAVVEGGLSWQKDMELIKDWIKCSVVKDFVWDKTEEGTYKVKNVPVGDGMVPWKEYIEVVRSLNIKGPVSLHIEYPIFDRKEDELSMEEKKEQATRVLSHDLSQTKRFYNQV
jgi:sugar phosphate isomerase/epimerase